MSSDRQTAEKSELLTSLKLTLERKAVSVEMSSVIRGTSGAKHVFDLVAAKNGRRIPIEVKVAESGDIELREVLETYAKSLDTKSKPTIMVAVPAASAEARKSAAAFGIVLVEGAKAQEALERVGRELDRLFR